MNFDKILPEAIAHAKQLFPSESCGVVILVKRKLQYFACRNISQVDEQFILHPEDFFEAERKGEIIAIVHSHPKTNPEPSQADQIGIERSALPWVIVNPNTEQHTVNYPCGFVSPLIGREFAHGVSDCYSLIRDYYSEQLRIEMPDFYRQPRWWLKGENFYRDKFEVCGFIGVPIETLQEHDVVIMRMASPVDNHGGIYVGNNLLLQHIEGKLSSKDVYGGFWRKVTTMLLRHKSLI